MLKRLMVTTAATALVVGSAVAQAPAPDTPKVAPPPAKSESMPAPGAQSSQQFVTQQASDQWLATKFKGTDVIGSNNEKIGDVTDILFDRNGKIMAYVIGVGGFLGIGQKDVALAPAAFQVDTVTDRDEIKLKLAMTRDQLKNAPEFKAASRAAPTTGQAPQRDRAPATPPAR
jgi:sporulation protein YlmC with PRC-barrel domain